MTHQGFSAPPRVSVVVVNWNRRELLERALESLGGGAAEPRFEVIVVDNGSTDGSVEMLERWQGPYELTLVRNADNRGFCEANNQGMRVARGEFIALLNNDAEARPGWLGALLEAFEDPGVGMAASKILVHEDPRRIDKVGHLIYLDGQNRGRGTGQLDEGQFEQVEEVLWPDGCAAMYRRRMLDEIGLFDEDLFAYGDDADLGLRARLAGWGALYMPQAVVLHHRSSTLGQLNPQRVRLIERNRLLLAVKLFPGSLLWLNGVLYLARLGAGLVAALRKRGEISRFQRPEDKFLVLKTLFKADWEALTMVPRTLEKRRRILRDARLSPWATLRLLWRFRISLAELSESSVPAPPSHGR